MNLNGRLMMTKLIGIPDEDEHKPSMISSKTSYIEFLKTLPFTDEQGNPTVPDYEAMVPVDLEYPFLIIWVMGHPIPRAIGLN